MLNINIVLVLFFILHSFLFAQSADMLAKQNGENQPSLFFLDDASKIIQHLDLEHKKDKSSFIKLVQNILQNNRHDISRVAVLKYLLSDNIKKSELVILSEDLSMLIMDESTSNRLSYSALIVYLASGVVDDNLIKALNYCTQYRLKDVFLLDILKTLNLKVKGTKYEKELMPITTKKK